jgi:hypothetical protein
MMTETQIRERLERIRYCAEDVKNEEYARDEEYALYRTFVEGLAVLGIAPYTESMVRLVLRSNTIVFKRNDDD